MKTETRGVIWLVVILLVIAGVVGYGIWFSVNILQYEMEQANQADNATNEIPWGDIGGEPFQPVYVYQDTLRKYYNDPYYWSDADLFDPYYWDIEISDNGTYSVYVSPKYDGVVISANITHYVPSGNYEIIVENDGCTFTPLYADPLDFIRLEPSYLYIDGVSDAGRMGESAKWGFEVYGGDINIEAYTTNYDRIIVNGKIVYDRHAPQVKLEAITITPEPEIKEIVSYLPIPLKPFPDVKTFQEYVDNQMNNRMFVVANTAPNKCELYALNFQRVAALNGYLVNFQVTGFHAQNSAVIGNEIWFIEPQTGEIWLWGYLD